MNQIHHAPLIIAILSLLASGAFCMTLTPPTPTLVGALPYIAWGTAPGGTAVAPVVTSAIVTSLDLTARNAGPVGSIENSDGAIIESIYLDDGFEGTAEMIYDASLTYPVQGSAVSLTIPIHSTNGKVDFSGNAVHSVFPCTIESNGMKFERKKEAMISFRISHAPGRDGVATS